MIDRNLISGNKEKGRLTPPFFVIEMPYCCQLSSIFMQLARVSLAATRMKNSTVPDYPKILFRISEGPFSHVFEYVETVWQCGSDVSRRMVSAAYVVTSFITEPDNNSIVDVCLRFLWRKGAAVGVAVCGNQENSARRQKTTHFLEPRNHQFFSQVCEDRKRIDEIEVRRGDIERWIECVLKCRHPRKMAANPAHRPLVGVAAVKTTGLGVPIPQHPSAAAAEVEDSETAGVIHPDPGQRVVDDRPGEAAAVQKPVDVCGSTYRKHEERAGYRNLFAVSAANSP